jgi:hypothetical protein
MLCYIIMDASTLDIFKKYSNKKIEQDNNAFINLCGSYDSGEVEKDLKDLNSELRKQKITSEKFAEGNEDILEKCTKFIQDHAKRIEEQVEQIKFLEQELPKVVHGNKENAEINSDLKDLINSDEYKIITEQMRTIKTTVMKLKNFLVEERIHNF